MAVQDGDPTSPVILLLAAGEGSRFGGIKQLADIAGEPMVRRVARMALNMGLPIITVTGAHAESVEAALIDLPLIITRFEDWHLGMGNSIAAGVRELTRRFPQASSTLVYLADQPSLDPTIIDAMIRRHRQAPDRLLATEGNGVLGPPVLFPRDCFDALMALSGSRGARTLLEQHASRVETFIAHDVIDVDTPDDLRRVHERLADKSK